MEFVLDESQLKEIKVSCVNDIPINIYLLLLCVVGETPLSERSALTKTVLY